MGYVLLAKNGSVTDWGGMLTDVQMPSPEQQEVNEREALLAKYFSQ